MSELVQHEDGCYLGLAPEAYLRDWALGYTGVKLAGHDCAEWWWKSPWNTIEPPTVVVERGGFRLGTATHVAVLDGTNGQLDAYEMAYGVVPGPLTHPDAVNTDEQLRERIREHHYRPAPGAKAERIRQLLEIDPDAQILDHMQEQFARSGKRSVSFAEDRRIRLLHRIIMRSPEEVPLVDGERTTLRDAFVGGLSEVSVFWTDENGIRQRARFDKLKPRVTIDLKTFASWREDSTFGSGLLREIKFRGYLLQAAHYEEARRQLRRLVAEGKVFGGTPAQRALLDEIAASDAWAWLFVFMITDGAPRVKGVRLSLDEAENLEYRKVVQDREGALAMWAYYRDIFGLEPGVMWFDPVAIWTPTADDWATA